jgi:hypothetical protein
MRTSAHALADAHEIFTAYDDLTTPGRHLKVPMPVMTAFEPDVRQLEADAWRPTQAAVPGTSLFTATEPRAAAVAAWQRIGWCALRARGSQLECSSSEGRVASIVPRGGGGPGLVGRFCG